MSINSTAPFHLSQLGLSPGRFLLYPSGFFPPANHEMLLTAYGIACHQGLAADFKLACVGTSDSPRVDWLNRAASAMGLASRAVFAVADQPSPGDALYTQCAGLVFPALAGVDHQQITQAILARKPVACSSVCVLPPNLPAHPAVFDARIPAQIAQAIMSLANGQVVCASRSQLLLFRIKAALKKAAQKA